jgi:phosphate/sulfate permease
VIQGRHGVAKLGSGFYGLRYTSSVAPYVSTLILTEIGTQFSIPLPMSISIFSGMLGTALAMRLRLISRRRVATYIMLSWVLPLILSIVLSYVTFKVLYLGRIQ